MSDDQSGLRRPRYPMPEFVKDALEKNGLMAAYKARPPYQQNDYIGWINQARREDTKQKRLCRMLEELRMGGVYMNMMHAPSVKE